MIEAIKEIKKKLSSKLGQSNLELVVFDNISEVCLPADQFYKQYNPEELQKGHCNIIAKLEVEEKPIAIFRLRDMVGCGGVLIFNELYVMDKYRGKGVGSAIFDFVKEFAQHYGYGLLQATDIANNGPGIKLFTKKAWTKVEQFTNNKTKNVVVLWTLKIA